MIIIKLKSLINICKTLNPIYPTNIYLLKVSNRKTRKICETYSKLTITMLERQTLSLFHLFSSVSIVDFEQLSVYWVK